HKLSPWQPFGLTTAPGYHREHDARLDPEPDFTPKSRPQRVEYRQERRLIRIYTAPKYDKNMVIRFRVAPYQVSIPPEGRRLRNQDATGSGTRCNRGFPLLNVFGHRDRKMLPGQE